MIAPLQQLVEMLAGRIVNSLVEGVLLAIAVGCCVRIAGKQNARTRFAIWFVTLFGIVLLPFLTFQNSLHEAVAARVTLPGSWAIALVAFWSIGVGFLVARLLHGIWRIHRLRNASEELALPADLMARLNVPRGTQFCISDEVEVPAAIGFVRPAVIVPRPLVSELSKAELEVVLLHELAHVQRWDDWSNLAQQIVKSIFFFHPAVLWIERRLSLEREMACDDLVLERNGGAKAYASCLISFAEKMHRVRALALVQPLVDRMGQLSRRVAEILDAQRPAGNRVRKPVFGVSVGLIAAAMALLAYVPQVVSFGEIARHSNRAEAIPVDSGIAAIGKMTPVNYVIPETHLQKAPARPHKKLAIAKHVKPRPVQLQAVAVNQAALEDTIVAPTLVIFESTSDTVSGTEIWRLCIWQITPDAQLRLASAIELKI